MSANARPINVFFNFRYKTVKMFKKALDLLICSFYHKKSDFGQKIKKRQKGTYLCSNSSSVRNNTEYVIHVHNVLHDGQASPSDEPQEVITSQNHLNNFVVYGLLLQRLMVMLESNFPASPNGEIGGGGDESDGGEDTLRNAPYPSRMPKTPAGERVSITIFELLTAYGVDSNLRRRSIVF